MFAKLNVVATFFTNFWLNFDQYINIVYYTTCLYVYNFTYFRGESNLSNNFSKFKFDASRMSLRSSIEKSFV